MFVEIIAGDFFKKTGRMCQTDLPASYVVACAVILQVLDFRPLVTMTANSYIVFGLRPVTVWLSAVVSADWTHNTVKELRCFQNKTIQSSFVHRANERKFHKTIIIPPSFPYFRTCI